MHRQTDPVLSLAIDNISKIDKVDCDRLSSLWTVFTKCAENLENGRRLENLSWRLWYRECQLLDIERDTSSVLREEENREVKTHVHESSQEANDALPALSSSVESVATEDEAPLVVVKQQAVKSAAATAPKGVAQQHLTPDKFHELVTTFGKEQPQYCQWKDKSCADSMDAIDTMRIPTTETKQTYDQDVHDVQMAIQAGTHSKKSIVRAIPETQASPIISAPETSQGLRRASSIVHGFNPSCVSVKKTPTFNLPNSPHSSVQSQVQASTNKNMFFLDSSSPSGSDGEEEHTKPRSKKRPSKSSIRSIKSTPSPAKAPAKKHTSFKDIVDEGPEYDSSPFDSDEESVGERKSHKFNESAIASDDEEDDVADEDDWASVLSESRCNSPSANMFDKMSEADARPKLTTQKSILSDLLTNPMTRVATAHSKSSPAIAQSRQTSPSESPKVQRHIADPGSRNPIAERSGRICAAPTDIKGSVSPRTTRRNMLATELSESLRRHLLWERKQKASNTNVAAQALLQRRHTAVDLTKMAAQPAASSSLDGRQHKSDLIAENEFGYNGAGW